MRQACPNHGPARPRTEYCLVSSNHQHSYNSFTRGSYSWHDDVVETCMHATYHAACRDRTVVCRPATQPYRSRPARIEQRSPDGNCRLLTRYPWRCLTRVWSHGGSAVVSVHPPAASTGQICHSCSRQRRLGGPEHRSGESLQEEF